MANKKSKQKLQFNLFYVDIPQIDKEEWLNVDSFPTKKEAIAYAMKYFNADKRGKVSLISQG